MTVVPSVIASALPSAVTTTVPAAQAAALVLPPWLEVAAIFAGALASALFAVRKKLDLTGVVTLAVVGGLGGGIIRDLLLQNQGIYALDTPRALFAALLGALIGAFFYRAANRLRPAIVVMDAISLSLFCVIGADKAIRADLWWLAAIMLGIITAVGGGVLRDVLTDSTPAVLKPGGLYADRRLRRQLGVRAHGALAAGQEGRRPRRRGTSGVRAASRFAGLRLEAPPSRST